MTKYICINTKVYKYPNCNKLVKENIYFLSKIYFTKGFNWNVHDEDLEMICSINDSDKKSNFKEFSVWRDEKIDIK